MDPAKASESTVVTAPVDDPRTWGVRCHLLPDLDGDSVGEVAIVSGRLRMSQITQSFVGPDLVIHSPQDGQPVGQVVGLPFWNGHLLATAGSLLVEGPTGPGVPFAGLSVRAGRLTPGFALVDRAHLSVSAMASRPFEESVLFGSDTASTAAHFVSRPLGVHHGAKTKVVVFASISGNLGATSIWNPAESTAQPFGDWSAHAGSSWSDGVELPDINGDGVTDLAVGLYGKAKGMGMPGSILWISGKDGEVLRSIELPRPVLSQGLSIAHLPNDGGPPGKLVVGAVSDRHAVMSTPRPGAIHLIDNVTGRIVRTIDDLPAPPPTGTVRINGEVVEFCAIVGESVVVAETAEGPTIVVGVPSMLPSMVPVDGVYDGPGAVYAVPLGDQASPWRVASGSGRDDDIEFGGTVLGPVAGRPDWVVVNATRWGRGRIVVLDLSRREVRLAFRNE